MVSSQRRSSSEQCRGLGNFSSLTLIHAWVRYTSVRSWPILRCKGMLWKQSQQRAVVCHYSLQAALCLITCPDVTFMLLLSVATQLEHLRTDSDVLLVQLYSSYMTQMAMAMSRVRMCSPFCARRQPKRSQRISSSWYGQTQSPSLSLQPPSAWQVGQDTCLHARAATKLCS